MSLPHNCECRICGAAMTPFLGSYQPIQWAAGHCGKCGAPYTVDLVSATPQVGPPKFVPSCRCWNVGESREEPRE